jgi:O-antigen/teichoic acid export membrane protein
MSACAACDPMPDERSALKAHLVRLSGQTAVYGLAGATLPLIGLVTLPVFTHVFSPTQYGALEIVVVAAGAVAVVIDLGLGLAAQRSYYHYPAAETERRRAVIATATYTSLLSACVVAALVVACAGPVSDLLLGDRHYSTLVAVTALTLPVGILAAITREVMRLTQRPWPYLISSVLSAIVGAGVGIALVTTGAAELQEVQWGALTGASLAAVYGLVMLRRELGLNWSRSELEVMLRYGLPLVPTGLALWGLSLLDRFILQRIDGLGEVGIYGVANRAASVALLAVVAFSTAWGPFMLALHAEDPEQERMVRARVLIYTAVVFGFIALLLGLFAREVLDVVAPGFDGAGNAVGLLAFGLACQGVGAVASAGITIARRTGMLATYTLAALGVNVALCFALIPWAGQIGAAIATLAAYVVLAALQYRGAQRYDRAPFELRRVLLALLICAAPLPLGALLDPGPLTLLVKFAALAVTVALLFATGVLGPLERAWLRELRSGRKGSL